MSGTVEMLEFLGSTVRYRVRVGAITVLADEDHQRGKTVYREQEQVQLTIPRDQILFVAA
ncbi:MAG: TOBE domain-containing protein [Desulfobulbaceae bacterium]|nr:TOBE domain-containing protein [Desulfobulbaceae bacterium]